MGAATGVGATTGGTTGLGMGAGSGAATGAGTTTGGTIGLGSGAGSGTETVAAPSIDGVRLPVLMLVLSTGGTNLVVGVIAGGIVAADPD
jgi:hypothetical protein